MLGEHLTNKVVTLHCKQESGLEEVRGIVSEVGLDEGARAFLVLPEKGKQLIIYADQVAYIVVHGTVEEVTEILEGETETEEPQAISGSVEEIIEVVEEAHESDEQEDEEEREKEARSRVFDMNAPEVLETLQGQSTEYGQIDLPRLLAKMHKKKRENETNEDIDNSAASDEEAAQG